MQGGTRRLNLRRGNKRRGGVDSFVVPRGILLLLALLLLLLEIRDALASSSLSSSSYESVRALDRYGRAVQLKHAQAAADQQGRLVVAILQQHQQQRRRSPGDDGDNHTTPPTTTTRVWIVSPVDTTTTSRGRDYHHRSILQAVTTPEPVSVLDNDNHHIGKNRTASTVYLACTGIQADADYLVRHIRHYAKDLAANYGNHEPKSIASAVSSLKRRFWGYKDDDTWTVGGGANALFGSNKKDQDNWARPMGIRTIVVQVDKTGASGSLELVEPSGLVRKEDRLICMGKNGARMEEHLLRLYYNDAATTTGTLETMSDQELEQALQIAFRDIYRPTSSAAGSSLVLQVEIVSAVGIEPRTLVVEEEENDFVS